MEVKGKGGKYCKSYLVGAVVGAQLQEAQSLTCRELRAPLGGLTLTPTAPQQTLNNSAAAAAELHPLPVTLLIIISLYHLPVL